MLFKPHEHIKIKSDRWESEYKGIVVDNNDPKKLGRVKCKVEGLFDNIPDEDLPWIFPKNSTGLGGGSDISGFMVPNINSELKLKFINKNPYSGHYDGYWQSDKTHQSEFDEDYPETYGFKDEIGNMYKINRKKKEALFIHSSGTRVQIFKDGNVEIEVMDKADIEVHGDVSIQVDGNVTANVNGNTDITCKGNIHTNSVGDTTIHSDVEVHLSAPAINIDNSGIDTEGWWRGIMNHMGQHNRIGNTQHTGQYILNGDIIISGISFLNHVHGGVDPGHSDTDIPH